MALSEPGPRRDRFDPWITAVMLLMLAAYVWSPRWMLGLCLPLALLFVLRAGARRREERRGGRFPAGDRPSA